jgi:hypothetical protein
MHVESAENDVVLKNLATFCDLKPILGQPFIYQPFIQMCACTNQDCTKIKCICVRFC